MTPNTAHLGLPFFDDAHRALAELAHQDAALTEHLILRLSELLRRSLSGSAQHVATLAEELDFLEAYLDIHRALMRGRLQIEIDVAPELRGAAVPILDGWDGEPPPAALMALFDLGALGLRVGLCGEAEASHGNLRDAHVADGEATHDLLVIARPFSCGCARCRRRPASPARICRPRSTPRSRPMACPPTR